MSQYALSLAMEIALNFYAAGEVVASHYAEEIIEDVKDTYSMDVNQPVKVECSASPDGGSVGLFQWVVTSEDGES